MRIVERAAGVEQDEACRIVCRYGIVKEGMSRASHDTLPSLFCSYYSRQSRSQSLRESAL